MKESEKIDTKMEQKVIDGERMEEEVKEIKKKKTKKASINSKEKGKGIKDTKEVVVGEIKNSTTEQEESAKKIEDMVEEMKDSAKDILTNNASLAARTLVMMMTDEKSTNSLKVDCAKEILTRIYGRTFTEEMGEREISLPKEFENFCV